MSPQEARSIIDNIVGSYSDHTKEKFFKLISDSKHDLVRYTRSLLQNVFISRGFRFLSKYKTISDDRIWHELKGRLLDHFQPPPEKGDNKGIPWGRLNTFDPTRAHPTAWLCGTIRQDVIPDIIDEHRERAVRSRRNPVSFEEKRHDDISKRENTVDSGGIVEEAHRRFPLDKPSQSDEEVSAEILIQEIYKCIEKIKKTTGHKQGIAFERLVKESIDTGKHISDISTTKMANDLDIDISGSTIRIARKKLAEKLEECLKGKPNMLL